MKIQHLSDTGAGGGTVLDVKVTWLTLDTVRLSFARQNETPQDYFLTPQELARVADHINDVLCR